MKEKLRLAETEKNDLLSKQEASRTASADNETLRCKVTALTGERDQLQLTLDALRQEHQRLSAELMEKIDAVCKRANDPSVISSRKAVKSAPHL